MNVSIKQVPFTFKSGKKVIVEQEEYEFCDDLWNYIKEFLFYEKDWYNAIILARSEVLRQELVKYFYNKEQVTYQDKQLFKAIETKVYKYYGTFISTPARILEAISLPRFNDFGLAILREGRFRGYIIAKRGYYRFKKEGIDTFIRCCNVNHKKQYYLDFLEDVKATEMKMLKCEIKMMKRELKMIEAIE